MDHDGGNAAYVPTETVATWPKGSFAESIAVDPSGAIFVSLHTDHAVVRIDPVSGTVSPFAAFETPVAGLAFGRDGALYVSGGQPGTPGGVIWRADPGAPVRVADLPAAPFLNGMALLPDGRLLVADSLDGTISAIDSASGSVSVWLQDPSLSPPAMDGTPGANGIKLFGGHAFITVTARDAVLRVPLGPDFSAGQPELFAERLRGDDFAVGADGSLYIATHPARSLVRLAPDGARTTLAAAEHGMTGSTAVAFGRTERDRHCVYVTTTGGTMTLPPEQLEPAKLVRVTVGAEGAPLGG